MMKAKVSSLTKENYEVQKTNAMLKNSLNAAKAKIRDLEAFQTISIQKIVEKIYHAGCIRRLGVKDLWYYLSNDLERFKPDQFHEALLRKLDIELSTLQFNNLIQELNGSQTVERARFYDLLNVFKCNMISYEDARNHLKHFELQMQT